MQKIFITCLILMTSSLCYAQTQGDFSHRSTSNAFLPNDLGTNNFIFYAFIARRCRRYMPGPELAPCQEAVSKMIEILDTDIILPDSAINSSPVDTGPGAFLFVAFKTHLIDQLSDPQTTSYLKQLKTELNSYLTRESTHFNLWENTLKFYRSTEEAAQTIATLLQDTSSSMLHLNYLERSRIEGNQHFKANKEHLRATIEILNMVLDLEINDHLKLLYPSEMKESLNKNLYHFYVPYYLSMALEKTAVKKSMVYIAPMLMTLTYEFVTASSDYRYVFKDPETLNPGQYSWKIRDILAGHLGASRGSKKKTVKTLKFLNTSFAQSTEMTVKSLLSL